MNILLVDDGADDQRIIAKALAGQHRLCIASTIKEAQELLAETTFDLILLDIQLPDGDGFHFCSKLQNDPATAAVPIIFISTRGDVADKVMGFQLGAEDYISKPFHISELRARVESRLKKIDLQRQRDMLLLKGDLSLNLTTQKVTLSKDGRELLLDLTPMEFRLLVFLAKHEDHVFSRDRLLDEVWGNAVHVSDRTVDMHISHLRRKLQESQFTVKSVHGVGYRFQKHKD